MWGGGLVVDLEDTESVSEDNGKYNEQLKWLIIGAYCYLSLEVGQRGKLIISCLFAYFGRFKQGAWCGNKWKKPSFRFIDPEGFTRQVNSTIVSISEALCIGPLIRNFIEFVNSD